MDCYATTALNLRSFGGYHSFTSYRCGTEVEQRRIRRVAQTIADLEAADDVTDLHVAEAITLRQLPEFVQP